MTNHLDTRGLKEDIYTEQMILKEILNDYHLDVFQENNSDSGDMF